MKHLDFLIAQMSRYAADNGLLAHYIEDLTKHDRRMFEAMAGWAAFAWVVTKTSSDVYPLGLHEQYHRNILDVAQVRANATSCAHFVWVNPARAKDDGGNALVPVTLEGLERGVRNTKCYRYEGNTIVTPSGAPAATLKLDAMHCGLSSTTTVLMDLQPLLPSFQRSWGDQFAMAQANQQHGIWTKLYERSEWEADQQRRRGQRLAA